MDPPFRVQKRAQGILRKASFGITNLLPDQCQSLAGNLDCSLDKLLWVSIGAGESQSVLFSVKLQTTKEETRLLNKPQKKKKLKALGVDHVVNPPTCHSIKCKKPRKGAFSVARDERKLTKLPTTPLSKSYGRGNLLHDTKVFSRRMRLKSHFNDRDDTNRSSEKYPSFVPKNDWQPHKQGPDLETFIRSVESDIASHKSSTPRHDNSRNPNAVPCMIFKINKRSS